MSEINTRLADYLDNHSSMIKLIVAGNGEIIKANAFAERIVTGHLGRIWVESKEGKGSAFYYTPPLKE